LESRQILVDVMRTQRAARVKRRPQAFFKKRLNEPVKGIAVWAADRVGLTKVFFTELIIFRELYV